MLHELIARVADAVLSERPAWVIQTSRKQAELIMDGGKAQFYTSAANWLKKAREASRLLNPEEQWRVYLNDLLKTHARKYKLVPLLEHFFHDFSSGFANLPFYLLEGGACIHFNLE